MAKDITHNAAEKQTGIEDCSEQKTSRQVVTWSSTLETIVSLIGYSAGMSDFWRMPYLVWRNGGGAFLLAYGIILVACGVPLYFLEVIIGQYSGRGLFSIWGFFPLLQGIGVCIALLNLCFIGYISTMRIWLLEYLRQAFTTELPWTSCRHTWNTYSCVTSHAILSSSTNGSLRISTANISMNLNATAAMSAEEEFFKNNILSLSDGIEDVGYLRWNLVLWAIVIKTIIVIALLKSVKTIGKMMLVTTFLPLLIGLAMFIQSCTYSGVKEGILFLITPDFTKLSESRIWIEASFMAFYSLGPGWGGVMVMGSHMKFHNKCLRTVLVSVCGDVFFALYNSFILYAVLGVMASEIGVPLEDVVKSGMSVGLVGYSRALAYLPAPYIWSVVFFFSVLIVDLDAEVICTETVVSFLQGFGNKLGRHSHLLLVMLICLTTFLINLPFCTQAGPYMFQLVDWYLPTWSVVVIALSQTIAMMWLYGGDRIDSGLKDMIGRKMPHVLRVAASYISPVLLLMLLLVSFVRYRPPTYGSYEYPEYTHVIGWLLSCSIVVPIPLVIIVKIVNLQGSFMERWNTLTQPSRDWGPSDSAYRLQYLQRLQIKRSWADIAFYNLTGRQRYSSKGQSETLPLERVD